MSTKPWNDWYHTMCHPYGTWLPGDPKGFRTRHHREHIEGDYRSPPPKGKYDQRFRRAKELMKRDPVYLTPEQRRRAVDEFVNSFKKWNIELRVISIDRIHIHALVRCPDHNPRHYMGLAKKESSAYMKRDHLSPQGGLWAVRCECKPINNASHFENVIDYIQDHVELGAAVWIAPIFDPNARSIQTEIDINSNDLLLD